VIYFLLVCNLSEIVIMLFGEMAGWGIILTPVMLLLINILGDGIPGISLAKEVSDPALMNNKPINRNDGFFTDGLLRLILRQTVFCSIAVLTGYYIGAFQYVSNNVLPSAEIGQTMAFLICGWTSIIHIFHVRSTKSVFKTSIRNNKSLAASAAIMVLVFGLMATFPPIGKIFGLTPIGSTHWLVVVGLSMLPTLSREIGRMVDNTLQGMKHRQMVKEYVAEKVRNRKSVRR
jgi:magnesium-transporting ATPase (P-type)